MSALLPHLRLAALAVYLPQLIPLVASDLPGHDHCIEIYWKLFAVLPGFTTAVQARGAFGIEADEAGGFAIMAVVTALILGGLTWAGRRWPRAGKGLLLVAAALSFMHSMAVAAFIRM